MNNTEQNTTFDTQALSLIEEHVRRFLQVMSFDKAEVKCSHEDVPEKKDRPASHILRISINAGDDGRSLIGMQGRNLSALQHLLHSSLRRQLEANVRVEVDVNGYRFQQEKIFYDIAEAAARKAQHTGRIVVLRPMSASERRLIHTSLSQRVDIQTESQGDEPNRRVVVRPVFL